jgi:hypothetical protein
MSAVCAADPQVGDGRLYQTLLFSGALAPGSPLASVPLSSSALGALRSGVVR